MTTNYIRQKSLHMFMEESSELKNIYFEQKKDTIAVIILNWNGGEDILQCVQSVFDSSHKQIQVVIVDNGSVDGSSDKIRKNFPQVHFISNAQNLGFAKGSNQGMSWALERRIPYTLLLNGDTRIHPNMIEELLAETHRQSDSVIACPKMYIGATIDGTNRLWFAYGTVRMWAGIFQNPACNQTDSPRWSESRDMEFASGCCMLIPVCILEKIGMLDEAFFAYCEDIDFSLRARKAGVRLRYVPSARLWHGSVMPSHRKSTTMYRYLSTRNNLWVVRKYGSTIEIASCLCLLPLRSLFRLMGALVSREWSTFLAELQGVRDGLIKHIQTR